MCIALLTTAHPKYALIILDNRDEFILRPTSPPHWWTTKASRHSSRTATPASNEHATQNGDTSEEELQHILSSRDLLRPEQGTWLGITRSGHFAVLTNYRELDTSTGAPSISGTKSRGGMVTAWLGNSSQQSVTDFVEDMITSGGTQGVGGFSLLCGKLRKRKTEGENELEPLGILSNKAEHPEQIPWIAGRRGEIVGLSNAAYDAPQEWPKVTKGKALLKKAIEEAVAADASEGELRERLFGVLDQDDLPRAPESAFEDYLKVLQESIFIPLIGDQQHRDDMVSWTSRAKENVHVSAELKDALDKVEGLQRPDPQPAQGFSKGMYGTQRQTVILVDWDGNVTYTERSLFDADGNEIEKGKGDAVFHFAIDGWESSS
ncbi:hypothetical protein M406DRAFT_266796 [Cryphonectria parasitica EP155]|uniref:DUF833-domain-containing protein n=1 Tax=Cryphonectria parasitica (strain ATCC 38755 / EP155) TaxID=660469 RepID=A0A9P5CL56_CRYP1|nr:uncharacterized protein M406DRAFT_266796 [Cryphonectria parasitica EP155]KAF3761676.1 hypothetical protein M406DRAFT_266796 [Cryphonectria parasitica EP155]